MYAIAFDLKIDDLKREYEEPYNRAYDEIRQELESIGFEWTQGNMYINPSNENSLTTVYQAINRLSKIDWFKKSVRYIRAFKIEDWSDFTEIVKSVTDSLTGVLKNDYDDKAARAERLSKYEQSGNTF